MGRIKKNKRSKDKKKHFMKKLKTLIRNIEDSSSSSSSEWSSSSDSEHQSDAETSIAPVNEAPQTQPDPLQLQSDETLPPEILNLLGTDPNQTDLFGTPIHEQVASRWKGYTTKGIDKTEKSELLEKYLIPENCLFLRPPKVNEEVASLKIENTIRQDGYLTKLQECLGAGLAAISHPLNSIFNNPTADCNSLLPGLLDGAKLILNAYHCISLHRRHLIMAQINPSVRKTIENLPIEEHLFSNKLPDAIKASNEVQKHSMELQLRRPSSTATGSKNLKRSGPKPRLKAQSSVTKSYVHQRAPNHHHRRIPRAASPSRKKARYNWTTK